MHYRPRNNAFCPVGNRTEGLRVVHEGTLSQFQPLVAQPTLIVCLILHIPRRETPTAEPRNRFRYFKKRVTRT